jgi:hypothetical protein
MRALNRPAHACATRRAICGIKHALVPCVLAALAICIVPKSSGAEELSSKDRAPVETEVQCPLAISSDYRLTIERWAPGGECERPVRLPAQGPLQTTLSLEWDAHNDLVGNAANPLSFTPPSQRGWRDGDEVLTFRTKAWSSFAPPTCRMPLGPYQGIPRADPGGRVTPRFWHRLTAFDTSAAVGLNGFAVGSGAGVSVRVPGQRSRLCNPDGERP